MPNILSSPDSKTAAADRDCISGRLQILLLTCAGLAVAPLLYVLLAPHIKSTIDTAFIQRTFLPSVELFRPKPLERAVFLASIALVPLVLIGLGPLFRSWLSRIPGRLIQLLWILTCAFTVLTVPVALLLIPRPVLARAIPDGSLSVWSVVAMTLVAGGILGSYRSRWWTSYASVVTGLTATALLSAVAAVHVFSIRAVTDSYEFSDHFSATFYSVAQVAGGMPLLVGFTNLYGLYPQFLEPWFRMTGLSVLSFTITMALLTCGGFVLIFLFLRGTLRHSALIPVSCVAVVYFAYLAIKLKTPFDFYFQYHPIRFIFPCACMYLSGRFIANRSRAVYHASFVVYAAAVLWNLDSGLPVLITWLALLVYDEFSRTNPVAAVRRSALHVLYGLTVLAGFVALYGTYILVRYGSWPPFEKVLAVPSLYYGGGLFMIPMELRHPWTLLIALYVFTLARCTFALQGSKDIKRAETLLVPALLGLGLFTYYQGRSHNTNLALVCYPAVILLALFADDWLAETDGPRLSPLCTLPKRAAGAVFLLLLCSPFAIVHITGGGPAVHTGLHRREPSIAPQSISNFARYFSERFSRMRGPANAIEQNARFLERVIAPGEGVAILSDHSGIYHAASRSHSVFESPGSTELLLRSDTENAAKRIESAAGVKLVIDSADFPHFRVDPASVPPMRVSLQGYRQTNSNRGSGGSLSVFVKEPARFREDAADWVFREEPDLQTILHAKYRSDLDELVDRDTALMTYFNPAVPPAKKLQIDLLLRPMTGPRPDAQPAGYPVHPRHPRLEVHRIPSSDDIYVLAVGGVIGEPKTSVPFTLQPGSSHRVTVTIRGEAVSVRVDESALPDFAVAGGFPDSLLEESPGEQQDLTSLFDGRVEEICVSAERQPVKVLSR